MATLVFRVYNSASGEIPGAGFTRTVDRVCCESQYPNVSIELSTIKAVGVDPFRAVLRAAHQEDKVGSLVAKTTIGRLTIQPTGDATYDLFLMSTASGVDYRCLDYTGEAVHGATTSFPDLHRQTTGTLFGCPVEDGPDDPIELAVGQFNEALSPFGLRYGAIDYRGADATIGAMAVGWTTRDACPASMGAGGAMVLRKYPPDAAVWGPVWAIHELSHAYLGAPDYYLNGACFSGNVVCSLLGCSEGNPPRYAFTEAGKDAARYWALTDSRTRGRSANE
jgi:hypothetical protein